MTSVEQSYAPAATTARLGILAAGLFVVGTNAFVIAGLLPQIAAALGTTQSHVSFSITLYALIVAIGSPLLSIVAARTNRSALMAAGLVVIGLGTALAAMAASIGVFDAGRALAAVGGAALVPTATAAGPSIVPPERRGRAIAAVGLGFTLATAVGAPAGTALAGIAGWRMPLFVLAGMALAVAAALATAVRAVPITAAVTLRDRLGVLRRRGILGGLAAAALVTAAFNVVYVFSAAVTHRATGGDASTLAVLLLLYGLGGIVGTVVSGRLADRFGTRPVLVLALSAQVLTLALLPLTGASRTAVGAAFLVWGVVAFGAVVPLQQRLVELAPAAAGISLSWYSTAMYVGIALAPVVGSRALSTGADGGPVVVPLTGAALTVAALVTAGIRMSGRRAVAD
ncbi:MAG TPA: MFS transporter [Cellulomonas sp.]